VPTRPSPRFIAAVAIAIVVITVALVAGSTGLGRPSSPPPGTTVDASGSPELAGPSVQLIDAAECALTRTPTADDPPVPPFGDGPFDPADVTPAWLKLCLDTPVVRSDELAAFCVWNADRSRVDEVDVFGAVGQPLSVTIRTGGAVLVGFDTGAGGYRAFGTPRSPTIQETAASDGAAGASRFELTDDAVDSAASPVIAPGVARGTVRWQCGPPPAPHAGLAAGQIRLHLDAPIGADLTFDAGCRWVTGPAGPEVASLESSRSVARGGIDVGITIEPLPERPELTGVGLSISVGTDQGAYRSGTSAIVVSFEAGGAGATLRLSRMGADQDMPGRLGPGTDLIDATVTWACQPPVAPGEAIPANEQGDHATDGLATLTFVPAVVPPVRIPVTCYLSGDDPQGVPVVALSGAVDVAGGGRVVLSEQTGDVLIGLISPDGAPAGEYGGQASRSADSALGPVRIEVGDFAWLPTDPRYVPLGGAFGPRSLDLTIEATCDVASARIPRLSVGTMDVHHGSGIDRSWSVPAACRWRAGPNGPQVASAANLGPVVLDDQALIVQAVPEVLVIVDGFGTSYGSSPRSTIEGPLAADGSSGNRTFTSFEPRRRITNVNGRIGGRGGVLIVDGSVRWDCGPPPAVIPPG
jgi:hypothetical protein